MKKILFIFILITNLFSNVFELEKSNFASINNYIYYINDKENKLTVNEILENNNLKTLTRKHIGAKDGPFWTKLNIKNSVNRTYSISLYNPLAGINKIDVYIFKENKLVSKLLLGDDREQSLRKNLNRYSSFDLIVKENETYTIVSKIENYQIYNLAWIIKDSSDFYNSELKYIFYAGILGGIIIVFIIYSLKKFAIFGNYEYLAIIGIAVSILSYQYGFHGILYFLNTGLPQHLITTITWTSSMVGGIFILLFSFIFFKQWTKYKKTSYITIFFMLIYLFIILMLIYAIYVNESYFKYSFVIAISVILSTLYLFIIAIYMFIKKEVGAKYYLIGQGTLLLGVFINTLGLFNVITYNENLKLVIPASYMLDLLVLVIAMYLKNRIEQDNLRKSKITLIEQSRFASIGQTIGHISHQWKNPLTHLGTTLTTLETHYYHNKKNFDTIFEEKLPQINNTINFMKKSIDEFSNFYKTKNLKEEFNPLNSIKNILKILNSKITLKNVNITLDISPKIKLFSYEHILSNIFLIIIDNSLDEFKNETKNVINIKIIDYKDYISIIFQDNAGGIQIKPIESIFEYFVTTKNDKGSGIGLAVVKMLVKDRLNGTISVKNINDGVQFKLKIPKNLQKR